MTIPSANSHVEELDRLADALGDSSRRAIFLAVREADRPLTASEVAASFGLHRTVARGHLERLVEFGLLTSSYLHRGEGGRPPKVYSGGQTRVSLQLPARQYQLLADLLLQTLQKFGDAAYLMAQQVGRSYGQKLAETADGEGWQERLQILRRAGADLQAENQAGEVRLSLNDCLFREISGERPGLVCALDRAMMEGLLSNGTTRYVLGEVHRRCEGDDVCRLSFIGQPVDCEAARVATIGFAEGEL